MILNKSVIEIKKINDSINRLLDKNWLRLLFAVLVTVIPYIYIYIVSCCF